MKVKMNIVQFAKDVLGKHLFDYEEQQLLNYDKAREWATYYEWVKPSRRENQRTYDIWLTYQDYLNDKFDAVAYRTQNMFVIK